MCVPLVVFLSAVVLHSVSAGGVYCAKTARARAAALGLDYPGVHGAPYRSGAAHHGMHPDMRPFGPQPYKNNDPELDQTGPNMASYKQSQQDWRSLDDRIHKQTHSRTLPGTSSQVQSEYTTDQALGLPRGRSVINRKSNFEEVKHVAPPTLAVAPGRPDLVNRDPQGRNKQLSFVYNKHSLVDESVPNRRDMSPSGLPLPPSGGHGTYPSGLTGSGFVRRVPVYRSSGITKGAPTSGQNLAVGRPKRIGFSGRLAPPLYRPLNVKRLFQSNSVPRRLIKRSNWIQ
ncbi:uncharacterized protein LOC117745680 [Cyclopterus lumpus]|uniref:uncharacterized protein LOC117745680 n=1 Tax=Cyclopterus lumpus TaxID=8103 RepID=UPI00148703D5|nr:uncharacterized protein LOC117745680 [Cyclopterus lumpus]